MKLAVIGAGNMATAIIKAVLESKAVSAKDITVSDINPLSLERVQTEQGVLTADSNISAIDSADTIILAVKPQNLEGISRELSCRLKCGQLVISILAGTPLSRLALSLGHDEIIRAMPNTPAQIGMGMTVWTCSEKVSAEQKQNGQAILSSMGRELFVDDEGFIDMATAISGSGPAYFFLFMECLVESAVSLGFDSETALSLVLQTALGSIQYAITSGRGLAELRQQVTSPGGTTAEAINHFNSNDIKTIINGAVAAAYRKAAEMGK